MVQELSGVTTVFSMKSFGKFLVHFPLTVLSPGLPALQGPLIMLPNVNVSMSYHTTDYPTKVYRNLATFVTQLVMYEEQLM